MASTDPAVSIRRIRTEAGADLSRPCGTCGQAPDAPRRRTVGGVIVEGCVDAHHHHHADAWYSRPEAVRIRAETLAWLRSL